MGLPGAPNERFQCPLCGGSSFGSELLDPEHPATSRMRRYCHGNDAGDGMHGCKFNWSDEDDWKYFLVDGRKLSKPEYLEVQEQIRRLMVEGKPYTT